MLFRTVVFVLALSSVAAARPSSELTRAFQAGVDAYRLGKLDEAKRHLERARGLDPKLPGPHRFLAAVAQAEGDWQGCIESARRAVELNPRSQELGDTRKLVEACRRSAGRAPSPEDLGERAAITVTTSVPGATVTIGGLAYGGTPLAARTIPAGVHEVALAKAGYVPQRVTVTALAGIVTDVIVELEPAPEAEAPPAAASPRATGSAREAQHGSLTVEVEADAVLVDGAPSADHRWSLAPGTYTVEIRRAGKDLWRRRVAILARAHETIVPDLVDIAARERRRRRGWILVGTGGGLVAVAGVTGVLAAREDGSARAGLLVGSGLSFAAGALSLGLGALWVRHNRAPDPDAVPPYAVIPVDGGAVVTRDARF